MASASVTVEPSSTVKRFPEVSDSDFEQILKEKDSLNTQRATQSAVRIFRTYLMEKQLPVEFESFDTHRLDKILSKFWTEARTEKGELYKKSSLFSLRHGINRHLQLKDASTDLINGKEFRESQLIFKAMTKELKRQGKGGITHHPPIDDADLLKLYKSFDVSGNNPQSLQEKVFVDVMLYFGRRGRENLRDLKMSDFSCATDGEGAVYIYMDTDELTKNHQLDPNTAKGRMYQIKGDERCPVRSFVMYKRLLNKQCPFFFQRLRTTANKDGSMFDNACMGHNKLGSMMATLSTKAHLSKKYTNHSLRATSVHILDKANVPSRHIMTVTGHKSENSLKTYSGFTDDSMKKHMSATISQSITREICENIAECDEKENVDVTCSGSFPALSDSQAADVLSEFENDVDFDKLLSDMPLCSQASVEINSATQNCIFPGIPKWPAPIITGRNANVTINYNIIQK